MPIRVFLNFFLMIAMWLGAITILPTQARAHQQGYVSFEIDVNLEELIAKHLAVGSSDQAARIEGLRAMTPRELEKEFLPYLAEFLQGVDATTDGNRKSVAEREIIIPKAGDVSGARISTLRLSVELGVNFKELTIALPPDYSPAPLRILDTEDLVIHTFILENGEPSQAIKIEGLVTYIPFKGKIYSRRREVVKVFVAVGFEHIVPKGLDHILFVVGLFLLSTRIRPLLTQITSFTAAHTVTLALGAYGIVNVLPSVVEPLIALSIVYVCVENIFMKNLSPWRPVLVFGFGLLHGLGFAGILANADLPHAHFITGLISFNIGVELGQLTVVVVCFLTVGYWFGQRDWYRRLITIPASVVIGLIGSVWFVERIFFT